MRRDPRDNVEKIVIIDEFTGRMMEGRRYSDGLHQALEAKEHVPVQPENQTLASITFQNYFRLYPKLAGMTGTAATEADEFAEIYKLDVVEIPTNVAVARKDEDDEVYRSAREKYDAVIALIKDARARKQPVITGSEELVGAVGEVLEHRDGQWWARVRSELWSVRSAQPPEQCSHTVEVEMRSNGRDRKRYAADVRAPTGQIWIVLPEK